MHDSKEKLSFSQNVSLFLTKIRFVLIGLFIVIIVGIVGILVYTLIDIGSRQASAKQLEAVVSLSEEYNATEDEAVKTDLLAKMDVATDSLVKKYPRHVSSQRALSVKAKIAEEKKDYPLAAETYSKIYSLSKKTYMAPFALAQAAVMYENAADTAKAIESLNILVNEYKGEFPGISYAYFNLGRLQESGKDYAKALETFAKMQELYPGDSWTNLAKSRIIFIESQGLKP